jgi:hypothetical protein
MPEVTGSSRPPRLRGAAVRLALLAALAAVAATAGLHHDGGGIPAGTLSASLMRDPALSARRLAAAPTSWHGGRVVAATGESVTVYVSDAYGDTVNPEQQWADFFAGLIHGPELSLLRAYVLTPAEVQELCGSDAIGCYGSGQLVVPGETMDGVSAQEIARHEYGHHVAANRANPPWPAIDFGPKRWASLEDVCGRDRGGRVFPGDEASMYRLNPGEAWAETYRVLNDVRATGAAIDWRLVDASFLPSTAALDAAEQDVRSPWAAPSTAVVRGRFTRPRGAAWSLTQSTPYDGEFVVELSFARDARDDLTLTDATGTHVLARGAPSGRSSVKATYLVCGERGIRLRVTRRAAAGPFTLRITRP